jgi:hypothetical protein
MAQSTPYTKSSTESAVVDSVSTADSDAASDMGAASDFMAAIPTFMAGMGMAVVRTTTAPTDAIEQHGMLLHWLAVAAYSCGVAHDSEYRRMGHLAGKPGVARLMAASNSQGMVGAPASLDCSKERKHHDR